MPKLFVNTEISPDGIYHYEIKARREGRKEKNGLRIVVPARIARGLRHLGWGGKWLHIRVNGETSFIASTRPHPMSVTIALPLWCRGDIRADDTVEIEVRDPSDWRCVAEKPIRQDLFASGVDWAALPPQEVFPIDSGGTLELHNRYRKPFTIKRVTPFKETMWLMGIYQAEGSKSASAPDWTFANKSAPLLARGIECLEAMGIDKSRLYLEVVHGKHQTAEIARSVYEPLGVEITTVRVRTGKVGGNEAGLLHVRNSKPFLRMTRELLELMVADNGVLESMPRSAVREFALGFLDGGGSKQRNVATKQKEELTE